MKKLVIMLLRICIAVLISTLSWRVARASVYCTNEQYERDHALIADAFRTGMLVNDPKSLRNYILVQEGKWYEMNYPQQIAFMQSFECNLTGGSDKQLLLHVREVACYGQVAGNLDTWRIKTRRATPGRFTPERSEDSSEADEDENRVGLTGKVEISSSCVRRMP
jgi:hypothetical protein